VSDPADRTWVDREVAFERLELDSTAWVDLARGWIPKDDADEIGRHLLDTVPWQGSRLFRYDHLVEEQRLGSAWSRGRPLPHPALAEATRRLQHRYGATFDGFGLIQYRDGADGQAFHRDTDMRWLDDTIIAILTFGQQRPWQLRPRANRRLAAEQGKGATHELLPASGDLMVMGGSCQAGWEHSVPYQPGRRGLAPRVSIQWRFAKRVGRPFQGASYRAPQHYSRDR
jgi:alkylated DNA repair dioxygenase AlkB